MPLAKESCTIRDSGVFLVILWAKQLSDFPSSTCAADWMQDPHLQPNLLVNFLLPLSSSTTTCGSFYSISDSGHAQVHRVSSPCCSSPLPPTADHADADGAGT